MSKPKIAIFVDQLVLGGVQKIAIEEVRMLRKLGYEAQLVAIMRRGFKPEFKKFANNIPYEFLSDRYPFPFKYSLKFPIFSFFSTLHLISPLLAPFFVKKDEWDIVVSHGTTTCLTTLSLKKTRSVKYIAVIHDPMEYILKQVYKETLLKAFFGILSPLLFLFEKSIVKNAQSVVVVSGVHAAFIKKTYKIKPKTLIIGANPSRKIARKRKNFLLASSRWELGKNPYLLLKIIEKIQKTKLIIAGSWSRNQDLNYFKEQINNLGLKNRVKIISPISDERLRELYSQALVWVHPNFEAFGVGGLEAAANGCPIVVPRGSGVTELFQDGKDGFFPKKASFPDFLSPLEFLVNNPQKAYEMGKSAFVKANSYSWKNHTKELLSIIRKALNSEEVTIIALETGHASESYLAGGDRLLEKMAYYFPKHIKIRIILPIIGMKHWLDSGLKNYDLIVLPHTFFDNKPSPTWVFFAYLIRIFFTYLKLRKLKKIDLIYSSTNVLPDIAPSYFFKLTHPQTTWVARVHHLIPPPQNRPGNPLVNLVSYGMQGISSLMIRSKSTTTLALNKRLKKSLIKLKFRPEKLKVLGAGIEFSKITKSGKLRERTYDGIFVGRIHPSKGIYDLVKIWQIVISQKPNSKVLIVGEGAKEEKNSLKIQIKKASLEKNIFLSGYISDKLLYKCLKSSKIFLFCDHEAGWGLAIGEAMAAGLPVVGYDLDIFGNVYKQGYLTVPLSDKENFARQILLLLNDKKRYTKLSKLALEQAKLLSWQQTSQLFQNIVTKKSNKYKINNGKL